jgi:glycosyltransferase involved in cell wall biosynthesis
MPYSPDCPKPIKVCFISPLGYGLYNPQSGLQFGGAEVQFYLLAKTLAEDPAYAVSVLTTVDHQSGVESRNGVTVYKRLARHRMETKPQGLLDRCRQLTGYLSAFKDMSRQFITIDADVYLHAGAGVEVGAYGLICRLLRRRFLFFIASSADLWEPYGKVEGPLKWLFHLGIRLAHEVICRSAEQQDRLQDRYGRAGVLIRTGHPCPPERDGQNSCVLWVGRGNPLKRPEIFLDVAAQLPHHRFVMVVAHENAHLDLLQRVRARAARLSNLELYEDVPWSEIDRYFARARIFINTSTYEGFPNTFVQAALSEAPVVSLLVDPDGVLGKQQIGVCAGGDFGRLLELTKELLDDSDATISFGRRARSYALANHSLGKVAGDLKCLIGTLIGQAEGGPR